jgi:hypothetical protein
MAIGVAGLGSNYNVNNLCLPVTTAQLTASNYIFAYWDDLFTGSAGICTATLGSQPNRKFVVTWDAVVLFSGRSTVLTMSIVLSEGSNNVDIAYGTVNANGGSAVTGMQNRAATQSVTRSCNQPVTLSNTLTSFVAQTL